MTFVFAGGGTGGHLYPGLAIAAALRRLAAAELEGGRGRPVRCVFVCSDRALDTEILKKAGVEFTTSPAKPLASRPKGLVRFAMAWGGSVRAARRLIRDLGTPRDGGAAPRVCVVAMGGFVAAPVSQAARLERVPVALVNLDAVPGKANRWIANHARRVFTATRVRDGAGASSAWTLVPPIIRAEADAVGASSGGAGAALRVPECRRRLGLDPLAPTLMITGGSQGARSINDFAAAFAGSDLGQRVLRLDPESRGERPWQILHQSGKDAESAVADAYQRAGLRAAVRAFTDQMADWWGASDLAIARAGAGNVAEVWANKVPTLFLPYPHHKDEHQRFNALALEEAGGAIIARDLIDPARNLETVGPSLRDLLESAERRRGMRSALERLGPADGAARIAAALWDVLAPGHGR